MSNLVKYGLLIAITVTALAQEKTVRGTVTYVAAGSVYTSVGWASGAKQSIRLYAVRGVDTIATMEVLAVSSHSCACKVLHATQDVKAGDVVVGTFQAERPAPAPALANLDTSAAMRMQSTSDVSRFSLRRENPPLVKLLGRVSLQTFGTIFDQSQYNIVQPGLVMSVTGVARDLPIRIDFYGNLRRLSRGTANPFSLNGTDASRIYRLSLEYDDRSNVVTVGRIIPLYAPSIGSIDGVSYARRIGRFLAGASVGFQPDPQQHWSATEMRKVVLFGQYQQHSAIDLSVTGAYARTYLYSQLDREAVSMTLNAFTAGGFSVYGYGDFDLRKKNGGRFDLAPGLATAMLMVNYRVFDFMSLGIGADASRPVYPFSSVQFIADTLLDRTLRSGATFNVSLNFQNGMGMYNTFSPRATASGFGQDYSNTSTLYLSNIFSTGAMIRLNLTMTDNEFTIGRGYGLNLGRSILGVDCLFRYQQTRYRMLQFDQSGISQTAGLDLTALLSNHVSLLGSVESMKGYGSNAITVFTELSWRF